MDPANATIAAGMLTVCAVLFQWQRPLLMTLLNKFRRSRIDDSSLPPLAPVSIIDSLKSFFGRDAPFFLLGLSRRVGSVFRLPIGRGCGLVVIGDYRVARLVLEDHNNLKPREVYRLFDAVAGTDETFFSDDGRRWKHVRKATAAAFAPGRIDRMRDVVGDHVDELIERKLKPAAEEGRPVDVARAMQDITVRVISEAGFQYRISDEELDNFLLSFQLAYLEYGRNAAINPLRVVIPWLFPGARRAKKASADLRRLARRMLQAYRESPEKKAGTIISALDDDKNYESDEEIISDIIIFLAGGFDTTAYTLSWALLELARNPEEQAILFKELQGSNTKKGLQVQALQNIIRETMRLHPTAALGSVRGLAKEVRYGKYAIPAGTWVMIPYFVVHRNQEIFAKADSFQPQRWEEPCNLPSGVVLPFAAGRRNCLGQAMATAELNVVLARLCAMFEFTVADEGTYDYFVTWKTMGTKLFVKQRE